MLLPIDPKLANPATFTDEERLRGYRQTIEETFFIFDESVYGLKHVERVSVTGEFRNWEQTMEDAAWELKETELPGVWMLRLSNSGYETIPPSSPFKFRINEGAWVEPPAAANNLRFGNLVFLPDVAPVRFHAEIRSATSVWVSLTGEGAQRSLDPDDYVLLNSQGQPTAVHAVLPNTASEMLLIPETPIDPHRVYYVRIEAQRLQTLCRYDGWFRTLYSRKTLGAEVDAVAGVTTFRLFAPRADAVRLYLYDAADAPVTKPTRVVEMTCDSDRVWEATEAGDLHGTYYNFTVHGPVDPGNHFFETHPSHISDPYARVNVDSQGKSRVWRKTVPATPLAKGRPAMEDVIAYEVHLQDFTDRLPVDDTLRGTMPAMIRGGLKNHNGQPIGFDYLCDLGINVVHLMPMQEYLHYPDTAWQAAFRDDPFMIEHGIATENYQWGYRTTHAFAIETRYRQRGTPPGAERDQFRDLVQAFHDRDLAVIIDLVPNHTGENMDDRNFLFNFNAIDLPYYYRTDQRLQHIGPYGNEVKTEDRPMVQRWLIDQCQHLINEFGIDGFRIDLAGQIDRQTLLRLRHELGDDVILYGEPWIAPSDPLVANHPDWGWYKHNSPITYFQDAARNAFQGEPSNPTNKLTSRGFAGGDGSQREAAMRALRNRYHDEEHPNHGINYLDIHDNWTLADRFATHDWDGRLGVDEGLFKIAATLLLTSLGPIVLHGGSEIMRSKGAAGLAETKRKLLGGELHFHGKRDTYNMRIANQFLWENVGRTIGDEATACDFAGMLAWWKGMLGLRRGEAGKVFRQGSAVADDYYRWILPRDTRRLGYVVDRQICVLLNPTNEVARFENVRLPAGHWRQIATEQSVDIVHGVASRDSTHAAHDRLTGGRPQTLHAPPYGLRIWQR